MSAPTASPHRSKGHKPKEKKSFWQLEIGKKASSDDEAIDHPPFVPTLPRVDLLPAKVRESIGLRKVRRAVIAAIVLLAACAGGLWYLQGSQIDDANAALAEAQSESVVLEAKVTALAPVKEMFLQITSQKDLVKTTMASQPQAAAVFSHLLAAARVPGGASPIEFSAISIAYQGIPAEGDPLNECANPDPFGTDIAVGCMTFEATAGSREQVSELLRVLARDPVFIGPYVDTTTISTDAVGNDGTVTFSGTSGVSLDALQIPLTDEQVEAIRNPPKPVADTESEDGGAS